MRFSGLFGYRKMLAAVDAVAIESPPYFHPQQAADAVEAGKHVWSEKPIANSLAAGQKLLRIAKEQKRRLWGAPITVQSPQFAFMARTLTQGARSCGGGAAVTQKGRTGLRFYEKGGGGMPDLAVYNMTSLTGLLGREARLPC
jgi:predicted dehydrogenase